MKPYVKENSYLDCLRLFIILSACSVTAVEAEPERLALIIGNNSYADAPLKNPVNDANDIANALRRMDFEIIIHVDANLQQMEAAIERFGRRLEKTKGVGLFYYSGHGIQSKGENYLIPVKTSITREAELKYKAVNVGRILDEMEYANNRLNIAILDSCRNNPLIRSFRNSARGLARIDRTPKGMYLAYSTDPGNVAMDGEGRNSPFTSELLKAIKKPLPIELVFKEVRKNVQKLTGNSQTPFTISSLSGDFYFTNSTQQGYFPNHGNSLSVVEQRHQFSQCKEKKYGCFSLRYTEECDIQCAEKTAKIIREALNLEIDVVGEWGGALGPAGCIYYRKDVGGTIEMAQTVRNILGSAYYLGKECVNDGYAINIRANRIDD